MYTHEIQTTHGLAGVQHYAERTLGSGLITVHDLGYSIAVEQGQATAPEGLRVACEHATIIVNESRTDNYEATKLEEKVDCKDLESFVESGIEIWKSLIARFSEPKIELHLCEVQSVRVVEALPSGLVLPLEKPETNFIKYNATPDEIEAMERIVSAVGGKPAADDSTPGLYI